MAGRGRQAGRRGERGNGLAGVALQPGKDPSIDLVQFFGFHCAQSQGIRI
jgi:hypothetical protein